jgi:hypothetical protein
MGSMTPPTIDNRPYQGSYDVAIVHSWTVEERRLLSRRRRTILKD